MQQLLLLNRFKICKLAITNHLNNVMKLKTNRYQHVELMHMQVFLE